MLNPGIGPARVARLVLKLTSMTVCFFCAIVIAPIGLLYLYAHHSKQELRKSGGERSEFIGGSTKALLNQRYRAG